MRKLFIAERFYWILGSIIVLFSFSFGISGLFPIAQVVLFLFIAIFLVDTFILFKRKSGIYAQRIMPEQFGLGDEIAIVIKVESHYYFTTQLQIYDRLPVQFQERDFVMELALESRSENSISYNVSPFERGEYQFGKLYIYVASFLGLVEKRYVFNEEKVAKVYPSVLQMKKMELMALSRVSTFEGIKKMRRIGHNYEFEQIKDYVQGDDIRSINWKATGKRHSLMVNQFQDERAQQVYIVIDKSRSMELRFKEMRYLDYAINSALIIANIALKKYDKAGLITFSKHVGATLRAERSKVHLRKILEQLYREKPSEFEADYDLLMRLTRKMLYGRALILLYSNFESLSAVNRILPYLRRLNSHHLLVVIFFEDAEIQEFAIEESNSVPIIYQKALAGEYLSDKREMRAVLEKHGIQTILSTPEKLSVATLNKYLELKSRGLI
jgi:uncharacterized protein (DUF58 family)